MRKKKKEDDKGADQGWLMTYGDLMSLLLTFFVLLLTFSSIQSDDFKKAMGSLQGALGVLEKDHGEKMLHKEMASYDSYINLKEELQDYAERMQLDDIINIEVSAGKGIKIVLNVGILFEPGKARLKPAIYPILQKIGEMAKNDSKFNILVEGHTDDVPIHTIQFESNWELSAARALAVVKFFINNLRISPHRLLAIGHSEFKPLVRNSSPQNRAKNRRVEIYIEYAKRDSYF